MTILARGTVFSLFPHIKSKASNRIASGEFALRVHPPNLTQAAYGMSLDHTKDAVKLSAKFSPEGDRKEINLSDLFTNDDGCLTSVVSLSPSCIDVVWVKSILMLENSISFEFLLY
jgi:hypothetical protein